MTSWRQPVSAASFAGSSARFACSPVLYIAMNTQGSIAITTIVIMRFRSMASRTWEAPRVTDGGVMMKVSVASYSAWKRASRRPGSKCRPAFSRSFSSARTQASFSRRPSMSRSSGA